MLVNYNSVTSFANKQMRYWTCSCWKYTYSCSCSRFHTRVRVCVFIHVIMHGFTCLFAELAAQCHEFKAKCNRSWKIVLGGARLQHPQEHYLARHLVWGQLYSFLYCFLTNVIVSSNRKHRYYRCWSSVFVFLLFKSFFVRYVNFLANCVSSATISLLTSRQLFFRIDWCSNKFFNKNNLKRKAFFSVATQ